jgi:hypothetical protein
MRPLKKAVDNGRGMRPYCGYRETPTGDKTMKIRSAGKTYDIQNDKVLGIVVTCNGKVVAGGTRYEMVVSEFNRITEDNAYAAREAANRAA